PPAAGTWLPAVDVCETAQAICVRIELPGVSAGQIKIALTSDRLRVYGDKKKRAPRQRIISHLCSERSYGRFDRVIPLRWTISVQDATAPLSNGLVFNHLPKIRDRRGSEFRVAVKDLDAEAESKHFGDGFIGRNMAEQTNEEITQALKPSEADAQ